MRSDVATASSAAPPHGAALRKNDPERNAAPGERLRTAVRLLCLAVLTAGSLAAAEPGEAQKLVAEGNAAWHAKRPEEAVLAYEKALALRPNSPEALYNLGTAFYRAGDFGRALETLERAAAIKRRGRLAALAHYNAGNAAFNYALSMVYSDPRGAPGMMERAIQLYEEALRVEAGFADARHNLEVAKKWLKLVEEAAARQQGRGEGPPTPAPGAGDSAAGILADEARHRSGGALKGRPPTVEKDW